MPSERTEHTDIEGESLFDDVARAVSHRRLVLLEICRERLTQGTLGGGASVVTESFAAAVAGASGKRCASGPLWAALP